MRGHTALASVSGLVAGLTIALAVTGDFAEHPTGDLVVHIAARLAPLTCSLLIIIGAIRRWLTGYVAHTKRELEAATEERRQFTEEMNDRLAEIARREEAVNRSFEAGEARIAEAAQARADEHAAYIALKGEHEELIADYNRVVVQSLQQTADLFRPRQRAAPLEPSLRRIPLPARAVLSGDAVPRRAQDAATDPP